MDKQRTGVKDRTGVKYNMLTALELSHTFEGVAYWLCKCECGNEIVCHGGRLNRLKIVSCGCVPTGRKVKNLVGQKFGRLTVVRLHDTEGGVAWWECECECGGWIVYRSQHLQKGHVLSCGCLKTEVAHERGKVIGVWNKLPEDEACFRQVKKAYIASANKKGHEFSLDDNLFKYLIKSNCYYCGSPPQNLARRKYVSHTKEFLYQGIDRKTNTIGYIADNCVPCCKQCNFWKSDRDEQDFLALIRKIYKHVIE